MSADLNFTRAYTPPPSNAVLLNFGAAGNANIDPVGIDVAFEVAAPRWLCATGYASNTSRPLIGKSGFDWQVAEQAETTSDAPWGCATVDRTAVVALWQKALKADNAASDAYNQSANLPATHADRWAAANRADGVGVDEVFNDLYPAPVTNVGAWQQAKPLSRTTLDLFIQLTPFHRARVDRWELASYLSEIETLGFNRGMDFVTRTGIPWERAVQPAPGRETPTTQPPVIPPVYTPPTANNVLMNFLCKLELRSAMGVLLNFGAHSCPAAAGLRILTARYYMTINTVEALLLPSLAPVPIYAGATISQDVGSYAWTLSATGPASLYSQLAPVPGQPKVIRVTVNGIAFVFRLDSPRRSQSFGATQVQITGRSVTASLGTGFARETTRLSTAPFNAQQLAAQALANTGVTLDWGIEDWLVPAGAWSHRGTPLAAVQAIAEAAGGYVQSHRTQPQLLVRHPYPLLPGGVPGGPWNWGGTFAADVVLSPDAIVSRSVEVRPAAAINAVYVSGTNQGVLALVKRAGTAGDELGAMVTDQLITANIAATQRGTAVLGAAGDKLMHQLELPVLTGVGQPGILHTDQMIEVSDSTPWRGRVRAVTVTHGQPQVRQTVLVEAA